MPVDKLNGGGFRKGHKTKVGFKLKQRRGDIATIPKGVYREWMESRGYIVGYKRGNHGKTKTK